MKSKKLKTALFVLSLTFFLTAFIVGCGNPEDVKTEQPENNAIDKAIYVCPMHPEITSDKAGKCSKCGMDLVLQKTGQENQDSHEGHNH